MLKRFIPANELLIDITRFLFVALLFFLLGGYTQGFLHPDSQAWLEKTSGYENQLPDRIGEEQLYFGPEGTCIEGKYDLGLFTNTNSMLPLLDAGTNVLYQDYNGEELRIGDIIFFETTQGNVTHRIIDGGADELGNYFITKGDHNKYSDPWTVRSEDIKKVLIATIY